MARIDRVIRRQPFLQRHREAKYVVTYPLPILQALIDERTARATRPLAVRRRGTKERDHRRLRHHRARIRPDQSKSTGWSPKKRTTIPLVATRSLHANDAKSTGGSTIILFSKGGADSRGHQGHQGHDGERRRRLDISSWDAR
jgi:hypothetical protein